MSNPESMTDAGRLARPPLAGRTIIITRALAQSEEFAFALRRYGARVVACPTIEIADPESFRSLDEAIDNLQRYDWIVFTSVNGVDYFLNRFRARGHHTSELDDLRVCAIGDATADRLREARVHVDVVPDQFKAEGVFTALVNYVGGRGALEGLHFLIPRAAVARDYLPKALEDAGAHAQVVPAYRTLLPSQPIDRGRIEAMLVGGAADCITFTSSSTVKNFAQLFGLSDLRGLLDGITVACIGDITAQTAAEYGLRTNILPAEYTVPALANAIAVYFADEMKGQSSP